MAARNRTKKHNWGKLVASGCGGFLNPPGHPEHTHSIQSVYGDTFCLSLSHALEVDWLDDTAQAQARGKLRGWIPLPITHPDIVAWTRQVMGYFRDCYQGTNGEWDAANLIYDAGRHPLRDLDHHAGVHWVRKFYPEWAPSADDILKAHWGGESI